MTYGNSKYFRINTYKKHGGEGVQWLHRSSESNSLALYPNSGWSHCQFQLGDSALRSKTCDSLAVKVPVFRFHVGGRCESSCYSCCSCRPCLSRSRPPDG